MNRFAIFATVVGLTTFSLGCTEIDSTGPDLSPPVLSQLQVDVEALIGGAMEGWWRAAHGPYPGPALATAADSYSSAWQNWGMLQAGSEPRQPLNLDYESPYNFTGPGWIELYRTLAAVRDGMIALDQGVDLGESQNARARAFGTFMQGMALGTLAQLYEEAYIFDEDADPATVTLSPADEVMAAAVAKLEASIAISASSSFTVPAPWVGYRAALEADGLARLARSQRARFRMSVARTPSERAAVDWSSVLSDVQAGITEDWGAHESGQGAYPERWAFSIGRLIAGYEAWTRLDYRTIGPADQSGAFQRWIETTPSSRLPFKVATIDNRITGASPTDPGRYAAFVDEEPAFPPSRGTYHWSYYVDTRWTPLLNIDTKVGSDEPGWQGDYIDFPVKEHDFIRAEAYWHLGLRDETMAIVNEYRTAAGLPEFTSPSGTAPDVGDGCIPRLEDHSCGDLFEALQYEKRLEVYQYGPFTEFLDDRAWGDLVDGTFVEFPAPPFDLPSLLEQYYAESRSNALVLASQVSAESVRTKREGFERFDRQQNQANNSESPSG